MGWLLIVVVGLALGLHLARNHVLKLGLSQAQALLTARTNEAVSLDPGCVSLDSGYGLRLAGTTLTFPGGSLFVQNATLSRVPSAAWSRGQQPPQLDHLNGILRLDGLRALPLTFTGEEAEKEITGRLTSTDAWIPVEGSPEWQLDGRLCVSLTGAITWAGSLTAKLSRLDLDLRHGADGGLQGSQVEGRLVAQDFHEWLPASWSLGGEEPEALLKGQLSGQPDAPQLSAEVTSEDLEVRYDDEPWIRGDLRTQATWTGTPPDGTGTGTLRIDKLTVPGLGPLSEAARGLGFPPLPLEAPGLAQGDWEAGPGSFSLRQLRFDAAPLSSTGEAQITWNAATGRWQTGDLTGSLLVCAENRFLASGPLDFPDLDPDQTTDLAVRVTGTPEAPQSDVEMVAPLILKRQDASLRLTAAQLRWPAGDPTPYIALAEGLGRYPGPQRGTWMVPLAFTGLAAPDRLLQGQLRCTEVFLQIPGGAPPFDPLTIETEIDLGFDHALTAEGRCVAGPSQLELSLRLSPEQDLEGSRIHGSLAPATLEALLPATLRLDLPPDQGLVVDAKPHGSLSQPQLSLAVFAPSVSIGGGGVAPLPFANFDLQVSSDGRGVRIDKAHAGFLGGQISVTGGSTWSGAAKTNLALQLERVLLEQVPGVAAHFKAIGTGEFEITGRDEVWTVSGPVTFDAAQLLFLRPLSRGAEAAGFGSLVVRAEGAATARLEVADVQTRLEGLAARAGPLVFGGTLELSGPNGFSGDLALDVSGDYLRASPGPARPADSVSQVHTRLGFSEAAGWNLDLAEPTRLRTDDAKIQLERFRLSGKPDAGGTGVAVGLAAGHAQMAGPEGATWELPFRFEGEDLAKSENWLSGTLHLTEAYLKADPEPMEPVNFRGALQLTEDLDLRLDGVARGPESKLRVELRRDPEGDFEGSRVRGTLSLDDVDGFFPEDLHLGIRGGEPVRLEANLKGNATDWVARATASHRALKFTGQGPLSFPPIALKEPALEFEIRPDQLRLLGFRAGWIQGSISATGKLAYTDPEWPFSLDVELDKLRLEKLPTDPEGTFGLAEQVEGTLSGDLQITGIPSAPRSLDGSGSLRINEVRWLFLRDVPDPAGIGPLPVLGRGPGRAELELDYGELQITGIEGAVDHLRFGGNATVDVDGPLRGELTAVVGRGLLSKSALLALPGAALGEVEIPITLSGTWQDPEVAADGAAAFEGVVGKSSLGKTLSGTVDTLWATFSNDAVEATEDTDTIIGKILAGGPDADDYLDALIETGMDEDEIQQLLRDYQRRHR